jgi:hypothetical protein
MKKVSNRMSKHTFVTFFNGSEYKRSYVFVIQGLLRRVAMHARFCPKGRMSAIYQASD